jgi:HD superfamily phosphodiesterase
VLANAERIAKAEKADLETIVPAALFHDVVNHPKTVPVRPRLQTKAPAKQKSS